MTNTNVIPELKQIIGALLFAAREPMALDTMRKVFKDAAKMYEGPVQDFGKVTDKDLTDAIAQLNHDMTRACVGIHVGEVANGYRLQNDLNCGLWIRQMLEKGRSNRLSKPALETLAIIAYRQPCTRSEIEAVRGVAVDAILKNLIEMQLLKVTGRSELPGRPWLFATTRKFLEYFGLKDIKDLPGVEELRRMEQTKAQGKRNEAVEAAIAADAKPDGETTPETVAAAVAAVDEMPAGEDAEADGKMVVADDAAEPSDEGVEEDEEIVDEDAEDEGDGDGDGEDDEEEYDDDDDDFDDEDEEDEDDADEEEDDEDEYDEDEDDEDEDVEDEDEEEEEDEKA